MCGIVGLWYTAGQPMDVGAVQHATRLLRHRGPDDEGFLFVDAATGAWAEGSPADNVCATLALGFRRLSILDLSPAGHQPMRSADGALWIVFNGEIYNYVELRAELQAKQHVFHTGTDTEVILAAYAEWGAACVERFNGMWAFALWDARRQELFCARDRLGIKPFYYTWDGATFRFASEIKALLVFPEVPRCVHEPGIFDYLAYGLTNHSEETLFVGVRQLLAAHTLTVRPGHLAIRRYWDLDPHAERRCPDDAAYAREFAALLEDAVRLHLRSDVAVGTCLSGGLDSSSIVCLANQLLLKDAVIPAELVGERQKTFSACFEEPDVDEREYMRAVLAATGAEENFVFPTPKKLLDDLPRLIWHQDEPFGSTGIFAQWCVMERVAARGVRVLLDGQGGDELLAGYDSHRDFYLGMLAQTGQFRRLGRELGQYRRHYDLPWRSLALGVLRGFTPEPLMNWARRFRRSGASTRLGLHTEFAARYADRINPRSPWGRDMFQTWSYNALTRVILPALLRYEDRNSMAHSVEARVPFLDYRLVEFAFALPDHQKIRDAVSKVVLRHALQGVLPEKVRARLSKLGFSTPERLWLNGVLGDVLRELAASASFQTRGYLDMSAVRQALREHHDGSRDLSTVAWRWINIELWHRQMIDAPMA